MNKLALQLIGASSVAFLLSGCSTFFTDHSDDYQKESTATTPIVMPDGSQPAKDVLVIPNENTIADLEGVTPYETPRAPFIFYPMVGVDVIEKPDAIQFSIPANSSQSKRIVTDFLTALHGAGSPIASQTENQIVSVPFDFDPQGWWGSLWSSITRVYPATPAFSFTFNEVEGKTLLSVQYREEQKGVEAGNWMSPVKSQDAYSVAVRLWGTIGRQLNQTSAYLSNRGSETTFPIWVDHRGIFAIYLGKNSSASEIEAKLNAAGLYLIPDQDNMLAPVPAEEVARIGDVVDFNIPGSEQKLFKVYRRNLDDVSWEKREYPYQISRQKAGDFLVIDVSAMDSPEVTSFHLVQRFLK
ncbi:hypothetical protein DFP75_101805 [Marinomonas alcarazii]|uniref:Uncharacterized protein n=1 Tax=Marinomonas alcarazii TaxID=491949 RepID=A0A318V7R5_9GAMM|nr:hypothetical protein [Marinomonas alcarazii]PYF84766.1 hypothetical protein DFP75_101805 [Marinomonas alcarazii]